MNEDYFSHEDNVFKVFAEQAAESLEFGYDTIIDATHLNAGSRKKILNEIDTYYKEYNIVFINFHTPFEICLALNQEREGRARVPNEAMAQMLRKWQPAVKEEDSRCVATWNIKGDGV